MAKILITGFDPFGGESINPAWEAVKRLPDNIDGIDVIKLEVPTVYGKDEEVLRPAIEEHQPDAVICIGQAGGRAKITVEKVAINLMEARIKDNAGQQPFDLPVKEDGETAYFSKLPVKAVVQAIRDKGIPAEISYTAGTFVCNDLMYRLLYIIDREHPEMKGGFIHVPYLPEQAAKLGEVPSMSSEVIRDAISAAIVATINNDIDVNNVVAGATH